MPLNMSADGTTMQQADEKLVVRFFLMELLNEAHTKEAGINKYDDVEMVEILIPGCRDNCIRKASDQDKQRFRRQYDAFLNTKGDGQGGTPLNQFPFISPSERKELEYFNIYTGEGLMNLADGYLDRIPLDVRPMIQKVKAFMNVAKNSALSVQYAAENAALKEQMALIQEQMNALLKMQSKASLGDEKAAPKRGRTKASQESQPSFN